MKKNTLIPIIILLIITIIFIIAFMGIYGKTKNNSNKQDNIIIEQKEQQKIEKVKSASAYFTVQSCVNKYINYVSIGDKNSAFKMIDSEYITQNNITENNVLDKIEKFEPGTIFGAEKMYEEEIDSNNKIYYVLGTLKMEGLETYTTINNNFCITVKMDFANNIFSIVPFGNGGLFNEEKN